MKVGYKKTKIGEIPVDWEIDELKKITSYVDYRGKTPPKVDQGIFLVTAKNIRSGRIDYERSKEYVPTELYEEIMSRGKPLLGDVLITTEAPFGEVAYIDNENIALAQRIIKYRGFDKIIRNDFLRYTFLSDYFQNSLDRESTGSTVKGIKGSRLHKLNILIPPLQEQKKIAKILITVDEKIAIITTKIQATESIKKGLMQRLLTQGIGHTKFKESKLGRIPESWDVVNFEELLSDERNALGYGILQPGTGVEDGVPMLRTVDLTETGLVPNTKVIKVTHEMSKQFSKTVLKDGDIILSVMGTLGRTVLVQEEWIGWNVNRALAVIRLNDKMINKYLIQYFKSPIFKNIIRTQSLGSAQMRINLSELRIYPVPLPSKKEQKEIADILFSVDDKLEVLQNKKSAYQDLKKGLMQQLLTGKVRVKIPANA